MSKSASELWREKRAGKTSTGTWVLIIVAVAGLLYFTSANSYVPGFPHASSTIALDQVGTGGGSTASSGASCASTQGWSVKLTEAAYGADTLAGTVAINGFTYGGSQNNPVTDLTYASSPSTSTGTYAVTDQNLLEATETSTVLTYPVYAPFSASGTIGSQNNPTVLASMGGVPVATVSCAPSSSNSAANVWNVILNPIQAPTSGTSAATNVKNVCVLSTGASLTTAATAFPSALTLMTCTLQILQNYRGAGYPVTIYGTAQNPITPYGPTGTGTPTYSGSDVRSMVAIIMANSSSFSAQLDPSAPSNLQITRLTSNGVASNTQIYIVSGFQGCAPSAGTASTTAYLCQSLPLDVQTSGSSGHISASVTFVDMQSVNYVLNNIADSAASSFGASNTGSYHGLGNGYSSGLTPTSGFDSASPTPLIESNYNILNTNT